MENVHNELCTLFVLRAASEPRFDGIARRTMTGEFFAPSDIALLDFLPWEAITSRASHAPYRAIAKLARLVMSYGKDRSVDHTTECLMVNAIANNGRLSRYAIERTLCDVLKPTASPDNSAIRRKARLRESAMPSEKSDFLALCRLIGWTETPTQKNEHVDGLIFTPEAMDFFRSL